MVGVGFALLVAPHLVEPEFSEDGATGHLAGARSHEDWLTG
jgi:hypothetical protein